MVQASEIRDRESLKRWLGDRSREDAIKIAQRTACRVLPVFGRAVGAQWARELELTALPFVQTCLIAGITRRFSDFMVSRATQTSLAVAARAASDSFHATDVAFAADAICDVSDVTRAEDAAKIISITDNVVVEAELALADVSARTALWEEIREDARLIEGNDDPFLMPLWSDSAPDWFASADTRMRSIWSNDPPGRWAFWIRWWDGVLSGRQVDWELQRLVALIPDEIWQQGSDAVAEAIAKLDKNSESDAALDAAIAIMEPPKKTTVQAVQAAMEQNLDALPPTFDAIEGLLALEIELEHTRNYTDDLDLAEAKRRIGVLLALHTAIGRLRLTVPERGPVSREDAATAEKLLRYYGDKFAELPRAKADEVVEGVWETGKGVISVGLVLGSGALAGYFGLPALGGMVAGSMVFAPKNSADIIKAAKEFLTPPK